MATDYIQTLYENGDFPALELYLQQRRAADPDDPDVAVFSALCAFSQSDYHAAYRYAARLAARKPLSGEAHALLGRIGDALGQPRLRLSSWQAAVNADPLNTGYRKHLAASHIAQGNRLLAETVLRAADPRSPPATTFSPVVSKGPLTESESVVVFVPVYGNAETTRRCIDSVLENVKHNTTPCHLLVTDDGSNDREISDYLSSVSAEVIQRKENRGFIHTANEALALYPNHDIVILNADTLIHGDWLDRLHAAAYSAPDIASVTPLSNNGELVSYPRTMVANPMPDAATLARLDDLAAKYNRGVVVEIPVGVGFCLYLRRDALDEAGYLDTRAFLRGYGEEVDLCLRFREHDRRNVCAADLFVAHQGNRSFGAEKAALVARNNRQLHLRYPFYEKEYDSFVNHESMLGVRRVLEYEWLRQFDQPVQLVVSQRMAPDAPQLKHLRMQLASQGQPVLILWWDREQGGAYWRLQLDACQGVCNLRFRLPQEAEALLDILSLQQITRIHLDGELPPIFVPLLGPLPRSVVPPLQPVRLAPVAGELKVVAVMPGAGQQAILKLALDIRHRQLPIRLWMQYATVNDTALVATGVVDLQAEGESLSLADKLSAGGVTCCWRPERDTNYADPAIREALLRDWQIPG